MRLASARIDVLHFFHGVFSSHARGEQHQPLKLGRFKFGGSGQERTFCMEDLDSSLVGTTIKLKQSNDSGAVIPP
jgi:hypothetical protein